MPVKMPLPVFAVEFEYVQRVTIFLAAESEDALFDHLDDYSDWDPLHDDPEMVDVMGDPEMSGDYTVRPVEGVVTANYVLRGGEIVELDDANDD